MEYMCESEVWKNKKKQKLEKSHGKIEHETYLENYKSDQQQSENLAIEHFFL